MAEKKQQCDEDINCCGLTELPKLLSMHGGSLSQWGDFVDDF